MIERAYKDLFGKEMSYSATVKYSRRFSPFNARASMQGSHILFSLSHKWKSIDADITIGLLQELLCKLFGVDSDTSNMRLYRIFTKNMHHAHEKTVEDPILQESFDRINEQYFNGLIDMPSLRFGKKAKRTVGSYNFHTDTITISEHMREAPERLLDFVMYHELLHKKLQFDHGKRNARHHTRGFSEWEKRFGESEKIEEELSCYLKFCR